MAAKRNVPTSIKLKLVAKSGNRCANPGCFHYRTHIHHIKKWSVYKTHNSKDMIALCPSCHDEVHNSLLKIDDAIVYRWKRLKPTSSSRDQIYVKPSYKNILTIGGLNIAGPKGVRAFEFSEKNKLSFEIVDGDIYLVDLSITTLSGKEVVKVRSNVVKYEVEEPMVYSRRQGEVLITSPINTEILPEWAIQMVKKFDHNFGKIDKVEVLHIEVLSPGKIKVKGIWAEEDRVIMVREKQILLMKKGANAPIPITGKEGDVLNYTGPIDGSYLGIGK